MNKPLIVLVVVLISAGVGPKASPGDWPMWRYDTRRSGAAPENLPEELHLRWTRQFPPIEMAWPNEPRLQFDASYEPVVMGKQLFVGSPRDGSVAAYSTESGEQNWRFYTNGPVRLAPVAWQNKIYFGSDDGWLYCTAASDGELLWKVCGAPADRGQRWHLGNGRLVSYWPVRGGPVLADGVVYFGAGIWPSMGVFVHAVDARSGETLWTNDNSHFIQDVRIDHNYLHESGISPQGHLLVVGEKLLVPNGRSMPAGFDRRTGRLLYYVQGYRNGDSRVAADEEIALVGTHGVVNLKDGREIGNRWVAAGKDAPQGWDGNKRDLYEGPFYPYKFLPSCTFRSVLHEGIAYGMHNGTLFAHDLAGAAVSLYEKEDRGSVLNLARWDAPTLWQLRTPYKHGTTAMLKAGDRLFCHSGAQLLAVNLPDANTPEPQLTWTWTLPGTPSTMLAADDKLFVVTSDGMLHCFGGQPPAEVTRHAFQPKPLATSADTWSATAGAILAATGAAEGYAVVLGVSSGRLVEELLRQSELSLIVVDEDTQTVNALRHKLATLGSYATRVQLLVGKPVELSLPNYLASLIVSEDLGVADFASQAAVDRLFDVLRPYGGVACLRQDAKQPRRLAGAVAAKGLAGAKLSQAGEFFLLRREGALPGTADWTHETADSGRSFFSHDQRVQAPLGVLWYGDGPDYGFFKKKDYDHGVKPQVAGGRLFALQVETNTLKAIDVYTGRLLWVQEVPASARYVAMADEVYVAGGRRCIVYNSATGQVRDTFQLLTGKPDDVPVSVTDIRVDADVILIAVRFNAADRVNAGRWNSQLMLALDRFSGEQLWARPAQRRYNTAAVAMAGDKVFCIDSDSPIDIDKMRRRGQSADSLPSAIAALEARTGNVIWEIVTNDPPANLSSLHFISMRAKDDWLAYCSKYNLLLAGKGDKTYALDASSGGRIWQKNFCANQPLIIRGDTFINQVGYTYDVRTGAVTENRRLFRRGGCNYAVGSNNLLFVRNNCASYVDIEAGKQHNLRNLRSGCSASLVAADGVLSAPCFSVGCVCNYPIQTSFSMVHMPEVAKWSGIVPLQLDREPLAPGD